MANQVTGPAKANHVTKKPESTHPNAAAFPAGLSGPALRALANAGITSVAQLTRWSETQLRDLHGMGPKALRQLRDAVRASGKNLKAR